jgi:hypothetical protein
LIVRRRDAEGIGVASGKARDIERRGGPGVERGDRRTRLIDGVVGDGI